MNSIILRQKNKTFRKFSFFNSFLRVELGLAIMNWIKYIILVGDSCIYIILKIQGVFYNIICFKKNTGIIRLINELYYQGTACRHDL